MRVTTTYLEMRAAPERRARSDAAVRFERLAEPTLHFYRYLYETVGREWLWADRRRMSDEELLAIIGDPLVEVWVAYARGAPAGYFELDRRLTGEVELAYFGLTPEWIGKRIGLGVLEEAVARAWASQPARVWVHTCSLDHPRARQTYEKAGFVVYAEREDEIWDPRPLPVLPR